MPDTAPRASPKPKRVVTQLSIEEVLSWALSAQPGTPGLWIETDTVFIFLFKRKIINLLLLRRSTMVNHRITEWVRLEDTTVGPQMGYCHLTHKP